MAPGGYGDVLFTLGLPLDSPIKQLVGVSWPEYWRTWILERPFVFFLMVVNLGQMVLLYAGLLLRATRARTPRGDSDRLALLVVLLAGVVGAIVPDSRYRGCAIPALTLLAAGSWAFKPRAEDRDST